MRDAIIEKLRGELSVGMQKESQAVYVMVEIRKYLDRVDPKKSSFPVLRTYCDWVAHISLKGSGARNILQALDDALVTSVSQEQRDKAMKTAHDIFALEPLKDELRAFLNENNLPADLPDDARRWGCFLKLYVSVVSDCPFDFTKKNHSFKAINKATLRIHEVPGDAAEGIPHYEHIAYEWELELLDGSARNFSCTYGYMLQ